VKTIREYHADNAHARNSEPNEILRHAHGRCMHRECYQWYRSYDGVEHNGAFYCSTECATADAFPGYPQVDVTSRNRALAARRAQLSGTTIAALTRK